MADVSPDICPKWKLIKTWPYRIILVPKLVYWPIYRLIFKILLMDYSPRDALYVQVLQVLVHTIWVPHSMDFRIWRLFVILIIYVWLITPSHFIIMNMIANLILPLYSSDNSALSYFWLLSNSTYDALLLLAHPIVGWGSCSVGIMEAKFWIKALLLLLWLLSSAPETRVFSDLFNFSSLKELFFK